jgi:hypothetical protein
MLLFWLKASITTVLVVTIGFIVLYTILLRYFTPVPYHSSHKNRIKFIPKNDVLNVAATQHNYYSVKWNISEILGKTPTNICKSGIEFLILIVSAPENIKNRQAIRETWCNPISYSLISITFYMSYVQTMYILMMNNEVMQVMSINKTIVIGF